MGNLMLNSKAGGTWEYEVEEDVKGTDVKVKVKYPIKKGFNDIPESHIKVLEADPGFKAKVANKTYEILKGGKALEASKSSAGADSKALDAAKDLEEAKGLLKKKISELKTAHGDELKKEKDIYQAEYQKLIDSRGEALQKVKALEEEELGLIGKISRLEAGSGQDVELLKKEIVDLKAENDQKLKDSETALTGLKTDFQKQKSALEGKNGSLEKKVKEQAEEIKNLKKK